MISFPLSEGYVTPASLIFAPGVICALSNWPSQNVEYFNTAREKIIGNDATMAAPPHCLGTHDGTPALATEVQKSR